MARLSNENLGPIFFKPGRAEYVRIPSDLPGKINGEESNLGQLWFVVIVNPLGGVGGGAVAALREITRFLSNVDSPLLSLPITVCQI